MRSEDPDRRGGAGRWTALCGLLVLAGACAGGPARLAPAATANILPGDESAAVARSEGVQVVVDTQAWRGVPDFFQSLIPVELTLRNDSGRPLRVAYPQLSLVAPGGSALASALPLQEIRGTAWVQGRALAPSRGWGWGFGGSGLSPSFIGDEFWPVRPYLYRGHPLHGPWASDYLFADDSYFRNFPVELPTADMVHSAIPEGVLQPGGEVKGFLFFPDVELPEGLTALAFRAELVDAQSGERFGEVSVPLRVR